MTHLGKTFAFWLMLWGIFAGTVLILCAQSPIPPTISGPSNVLIYPPAGQTTVAFQLTDADGDPDALAVTWSSSNTNLLSPTNITFQGMGTNRTATFIPNPGVLGTSIVSIVVTDASDLRATNYTQVVVAYFSDVTPAFSGSNIFNPRWCDYDNDNDLDLYLGGSIYRNDGNLQFIQTADFGDPGSRNGVAWADYDRDGYMDIAVSGGIFTAIFRNSGNGTFTRLVPNLHNVGVYSLAWGDYNNDGLPDLLLADANGSQAFTGLYRNNGDHTFTLVTNAGFTKMASSAVAWGDIDNDGRQDVLINGLGSGAPLGWTTDLYRNNGDGSFSRLSTGFSGANTGSVAFGDYDNDGQLDLLTSGFNAGNYLLRVYRNTGGNQFIDSNLRLQGQSSGDSQWIDFNNDGYLDIFVNGCIVNYCDASIGALYRNDRNGSFSNANAGLDLSPHHAYPVSWGDFDDDGDLDVFFYRLFRNNCSISNSSPSTPLNPVAELLPGNDVRLRWSPLADDETPSPGLSYGVRVGRTPNGVDFISPHADVITGYRRIPERGPINTNEYIIPDMPVGTYYWSVQAIDTSFAGSPFAAEGTFTITNTRPFVSAIPNQNTVPGRATDPIPFTIGDVETASDDLLLNGYSSDISLLPNENIVFGGSASNRTVTMTPVPSSNGIARITITATDAGGLVATSRFDLVVQTFTDVQAGLPRMSSPFNQYFHQNASAWADYDNDGDLDIALTGDPFSNTLIFRNDSGGFTNLNSNLPTRDYADLAWGDYNNDGYIDFAANGLDDSFYNPATYLFRNNPGTHSFTTLTLEPDSRLGKGSLDWGDYDNDGDYDLLVTGLNPGYPSPYATNGIALMRNDSGVLTNSGAVLLPVAGGGGVFGDYDNDGDLDILIAGQAGEAVATAFAKLFRNDGNGDFTQIRVALPGITSCALAFGDYNNDGLLDVLLAGLDASSNRVARVNRNMGSDSFIDSGGAFIGVEEAAVAWGDYDNDGFLDIIVAGSTNVPGIDLFRVTRVYHNDGGSSFSLANESLPPTSRHKASWGDYDDDGDLDLLLGSYVYRNHWNISNTPPTAPGGLAFVRTNNGVMLSWSPSSDAETTDPRGLNYNLRIGTTPGGSEIMSPQADAITGKRRVAQRGNIGQRTSWRITLPNGTFYWSVQAIDPGFAGSPFASGGTFTLSHPVISPITNRDAAVNSLIPSVLFTVSDAETPAENLVLIATSSNTNLVHDSSLMIGQGGTNRTLQIGLRPNQSGVTRITITATDEHGEVGMQTFLLTVEPFSEIPDALEQRAGPLAWGDYDNDGDLDLVHGSTIYSNHANGTFTPLPAYVGPAEGTASWGDYDNDGDLDLLISGSNAARVYRNDGSGNFVDIHAPLQPPSTPGSAAWGDYDNDGDLDILLAGAYSTLIYRNSGSDVFVEINVGVSGLPNGSVAWGDYDHDGDLDILLAGSGVLRVYQNNGNGTFTPALLGTSLSGLYYSSVAWSDFDNDGDLDFAAIGSPALFPGGSAAIYIYRNTGLNFENTFSWGIVGVWRGALAWADYDSDGDLDLLIAGETRARTPLTRIYRNDNPAFANSMIPLPALYNSFAAWGDFDGDHDLDLALSGWPSGFGVNPIARIYRHYASASNTPPSAPLTLQSAVVGKSVRLSWSAATDPNQSGGFSYNVRVGRSPGGCDVVSPMSAPDGTRRIVALGNANQTLFWTYTNLTGGTYYWSVQAIDHSFAGSPFAEERTFVISNEPPVVTNNSLTVAEDTPVSTSLFGYDPDNDPLTFSIETPPAFGQLLGTPPNVTYQPATDYFGADQFTYRAHDRTELSLPGAVSIQITPVVDVTSPSLRIEWLNGNTAQLSAYGEPYEKGRLEASEDLQNWVTLTNFVGTNVLIHLIDADSSNFTKRFYRARWSQTQ